MSIAIIGIGNWGKNLLKEFSKIEKVSYCYSNGNKKNLIWLKQNYPNLVHTTSLSTILNNSKVETLVIATPNRTHYDLVLKSLNSGKNVFVEKPLCLSYKEGKELVKIAQNKKLFLFVGHVFLYHPIYTKLKKLIVKDPIQQIRISWEKCGTFDENLIFNLMSHQLSVVQDLLGKPKKISIVDQFPKHKNIDIITVKSIFEKNQICLFEVNRLSNTKKWQMSIFTKNNVFLWENNNLYKLNKIKKSFKIIYQNKKTPLEIECRKFISLLKINRFSNDSSLNALEILATIEKII